MSGERDKQKARIRKALERLQHGELAMRDFTSAVGKLGAAEYKTRWAAELSRREWLKRDKPEALVKYEALLKKADFHHNRAEGLARKRTRKRGVDGVDSTTRAYHNSETAFERALEHLKEQLHINPTLVGWLDRQVDFENHENAPNIDPQSVPRAVTSRSANKIGGMNEVVSKADIKQAILEETLAAIEQEDQLLRDALAKRDELQNATIRAKLEALRSRSGKGDDI